ncbi:MAG: lipid-binding SYLF domain-containing protein [Syntrophobacteraceae bacterium]|nr:lipid-binding SYLF domain-containing protein [Syntrophobacteraceae bacterium]
MISGDPKGMRDCCARFGPGLAKHELFEIEDTIMRYCSFKLALLALLLAGTMLINPHPVLGASAAEIDRAARSALQQLYAQSPSAKALGQKARAVLVFPSIVKGGFIVGGQYGEGVLVTRGKTAGYYSTIQASYGLQAGLQKYGYALFLMSDSAIDYINRTDGWELGTGPSIVIVDVGKAASMSTTTLHSDIYAFFFGQKGLMGGLGLQGTKISRISK